MLEEMEGCIPSTGFFCSIIKRLLGCLGKDDHDVNGSFSTNKKVTVVFILGCTGSGKSTQSANIAKHYGYKHLSTGDLLRAEVASGSENGTMIQELMNEGKLVPTDISVKVLLRAIHDNENDKFIVDGFPREEENRTAFERITGIIPKFVLFLDCPVEELKRRVLARNQGREDDNLNTILKRLKVFNEYTKPVIDHYSSIGKVHEIDAGRPAEDVFNDIKRVFSQHGVEATSS